MGLREVARKAAQTAIQTTGDIAVSSNYLAFASTSYNASAGSDTTTFSSTAGVKVIFAGFKTEQIDFSNVEPSDKRALIAAKDISGVTPSTQDQIKVNTSVTWEVQSVMIDPADALWILHVRQP